MVAIPIVVGNTLSPVSGTIIVVDATEEDTQQFRRSGPRFPRPHIQRLETNKRIAEGTLPPNTTREELDFDEEAVTKVNMPVHTPRPSTAS